MVSLVLIADMPTVTCTQSRRRFEGQAAVDAMRSIGIIYERWGIERLPSNLSSRNLTDAEKQAVLAAFAPDIDRLKRERGYRAADLVTLYPDTPNLDELLAKFNKQHTHADDEVRFIVQGAGVFELHPEGHEPVAAEVVAGDFITVPARYRHLFYLTAARQITAIRIFTDPAGWVAQYVG